MADTIPEVTEKLKPSGFPMATTGSPTETVLESPSDSGSSAGASPGSTLRRATSLVSSTPTTVAVTCVASALWSWPLKTTSTESARTPFSITTWAFVRM